MGILAWFGRGYREYIAPFDLKSEMTLAQLSADEIRQQLHLELLKCMQLDLPRSTTSELYYCNFVIIGYWADLETARRRLERFEQAQLEAPSNS